MQPSNRLHRHRGHQGYLRLWQQPGIPPTPQQIDYRKTKVTAHCCRDDIAGAETTSYSPTHQMKVFGDILFVIDGLPFRTVSDGPLSRSNQTWGTKFGGYMAAGPRPKPTTPRGHYGHCPHPGILHGSPVALPSQWRSAATTPWPDPLCLSAMV